MMGLFSSFFTKAKVAAPPAVLALPEVLKESEPEEERPRDFGLAPRDLRLAEVEAERLAAEEELERIQNRFHFRAPEPVPAASVPDVRDEVLVAQEARIQELEAELMEQKALIDTLSFKADEHENWFTIHRVRNTFGRSYGFINENADSVSAKLRRMSDKMGIEVRKVSTSWSESMNAYNRSVVEAYLNSLVK